MLNLSLIIVNVSLLAGALLFVALYMRYNSRLLDKIKPSLNNPRIYWKGFERFLIGTIDSVGISFKVSFNHGPHLRAFVTKSMDTPVFEFQRSNNQFLKVNRIKEGLIFRKTIRKGYFHFSENTPEIFEILESENGGYFNTNRIESIKKLVSIPYIDSVSVTEKNATVFFLTSKFNKLSENDVIRISSMTIADLKKLEV